MELRLGEKFKLIKKIGSGAFGEIYKGKDLSEISIIHQSSLNISSTSV
jgi:hypothetical protein